MTRFPGARRLRNALALPRRIDALRREHEDLSRAHERDIAHVWELLDGHEERIAQLERRVRISTVMAWIEQASVPERKLISVVLPTHRRAEVLPRAIESVLGQSYGRWELLVCADGDDRGPTEAAMGAFDDQRIRYLPRPGDPIGANATRNRGLDAATGELITYLDDDNRMDRNWLKSVAWAFDQHPATEVLHAAIAIDDTARHHGEPGAEMPSVWLERYDRERLLEANVADTAAIAHRAGLPEARWDETLETVGDWDLFLRLTVDREPLTLPVIACFYYTDAEGRLTDRGEQEARDREALRQRARAARGAE